MDSKKFWKRRQFTTAAALLVLVIGLTAMIVTVAYVRHGPLLGRSVAASLYPTPTPTVSGYELDIPKLSIAAPVMLDISGSDEAVYLKALENGVAQYAGTSVPGTPGNSLIFGHSSYYHNKPGHYKEVFAHLDQVAVGDEIVIRHQGSVYRYKVFKKAVVAANDFSILNSIGNKETVTLMTCWPPKTVLKRYVVQAERIAVVSRASTN